MNGSTFWTIKYMNGSVFSMARYMNGVGFETLARTLVPDLPPSYPASHPEFQSVRSMYPALIFEPRREKTCKLHVRTTKVQINLRIRAV